MMYPAPICRARSASTRVRLLLFVKLMVTEAERAVETLSAASFAQA